MLFVVNSDFGTAQLRGEVIAKEIGARCLFADLDGARNQTVVFVKDADRGLVEDAKDRQNRVVLDVIDLYCYKDRRCGFADLVDVLIVPNKASIEFYRTEFPKASFAVIPHQWDHRLKGNAPQDRCRTGYIGKGFNCTVDGWEGVRVVNSTQFLQAPPYFNLHICLNQRNEKHVLLKPSTKVVTAAAVLANVVTYGDPGALELLGSDYPYIVTEDPLEAIKEAQGSFGSQRWKMGRERMKEVKEKTSLDAVCRLYRELE